MGFDSVGTEIYDIHGNFCELTNDQRIPGFLGVTTWHQSIGIRILRLDGMALDHYIH